MTVKAINLAWVSVSNFKKSEKFFTDVVGLKIDSSNEDGYEWAELSGHEGGSVLGIGVNNDSNEPVKPGNNAVITFTVDDIIKKKAEMEKMGVVFIGDIIEIPGYVKMAFFKDPDGNIFQLVAY
jgi:predicted enzyme related to lactoylglutathione lyase